MAGKLLIDAHYSDETRIAIIDDSGNLENFEMESVQKRPIKGNIYLAKVVRVEPSIQAAFVDYGDDKHGFLPLSEIHYDYFNKNVMEAMDSKQRPLDEDEEQFELNNRRQMKIQEVISHRQIILVQAEKEIRGNKCAFFTTFISIPGRYCILLPNPPKGKMNGISRRIAIAEKSRLRELMNSLEVPDGMGLIVRTAGENRTKQELKKDLEYLNRQWNEVREKVTVSIAPMLIYEEGNLVKRSIRDLYQKNLDKIVVQGKDAYKDARAFMRTFTPSHVKKVELHEDTDVPIFHKYGVEEKVSKILDPVVCLPSGGTIVINTTEALTAIDVNSGKSRNERDIEETALKTNLEAIPEIARQIKLRDVAGIIVIDFIDMMEKQANIKVEKKMIEAMKNDYADIQFNRLSQFGLMEMSRQRLKRSLVESNFVQCKHCNGVGRILSAETVAFSIVRKMENFLINQDAESIIVEVADEIGLCILNKKRKLLAELEALYNTEIEIIGNSSISCTDCNITVKEQRKKEEIEPAKENKSEQQPQKQQEKKPGAKAKPRKMDLEGDDLLLVNKNNIKLHMKEKLQQKEEPTQLKAESVQQRQSASTPKNNRAGSQTPAALEQVAEKGVHQRQQVADGSEQQSQSQRKRKRKKSKRKDLGESGEVALQAKVETADQTASVARPTAKNDGRQMKHDNKEATKTKSSKSAETVKTKGADTDTTTNVAPASVRTIIDLRTKPKEEYRPSSGTDGSKRQKRTATEKTVSHVSAAAEESKPKKREAQEIEEKKSQKNGGWIKKIFSK
ncbi:MAG: ribonuclease E/G [Holosporales bacterium]|jgi:ribonuclease E|nr:ribonuclease E/G [Holosporales bacterium]